MFHPSPPIPNLPGSLDGSFTLRYVTTPSSAPTFTTTTASSANPLPITYTSLQCLAAHCRSYSGHGTDGPSPGKIDSYVIAHPPPIPGRVTERISGFSSHGYLPPLPGLPEVHTKLKWQFWLRLPSDPSLAPTSPFIPSSGSPWEFLQAPSKSALICLHLHVTSFQVRDRTFTS